MIDISLAKMIESPRHVAVAILVTVAIVFAILVGAYVYNFHGHEIAKNPEQWGQLGDYAGGILNPAIAFAALIAVFYAIYLQKLELKKAHDALRIQASLMDEQIFDSKFFSMLSLYNESISTIKYSFDDHEYHGYEAIRECLYELLHKTADFADYYRKENAGGTEADFYPLLAGYNDYYLGTSTILMVVTRISDISKIVENSGVEDKQHYHDLFCSYISKETKIWVYIYFIFTKQQDIIPPGYGCLGMFLQYMGEELPSKIDLSTDTINFICVKIQSMVNSENKK